MIAGTISEGRKRMDTPLPNTTEVPTTTTTVVSVAGEEKPTLDKADVLDTRPKAPQKPKEPEHLQDSKCTFCKADAIATLSFRFALVLVLIAFSYHLIKRPK